MVPDALAPWLLATKLALYLSALFGIGLGVQAAFGIIERGSRQRALRAAVISAFAALIFALVRAVLTNAELGAPLDAANFSLIWQTQGSALLAIAGGAALLAIATFRQSSAFAAIGAVTLATSFALTGHAQGVPNPLLTPLAVAVHVTCAGFWMVAPLTLWPGRSVQDDVLLARVQRFSTLALSIVPTLFVLGVVLALRLAGGLGALINTLYGQFLIAKLFAATGAMALGAFNKLVVTQALAANAARGRRLLRFALLADLVLFAAALLLVGWATTMTGPPEQ